MRLTLSKIVALFVGLFLVGYFVYYFHPLTVGGILIVPALVAMIWAPDSFSDLFPDRIGQKVVALSAWGMLVLLLGVVASCRLL